jgi:hypothetical protein
MKFQELPEDILQMIYKTYHKKYILEELQKIHKRFNSHYIHWSLLEHIRYVKSLKKFVKINKKKHELS